MKALLLYIISFIICTSLKTYGQVPDDVIPNHSFENWVEGEPLDWFTTNVRQGNFVFVHIYPSDTAYRGQLSITGEVKELAGGAPPPSGRNLPADGG